MKSETYTHDNILQIIEFQWFAIPDSVKNITLGLKMINTNSVTWSPYNGNTYVEVTTDRKTWHKLAIVPKTGKNWKEVSVSLNDYIGNDYVQARIRYESSGEGEILSWSRDVYIDDLFINFESIDDMTDTSLQEEFDLSISPNPSDGIVNITSGLKQKYNISVYNILGVRLFSDDNFTDGPLDLNFLPKGTYFITVDNGTDRITKRFVLK